MIGYNGTTGIGVGLQYPGYDVVGTHDQTSGSSADPFCNEKVGVDLWLNGWFIDIKYPQPGGEWREIWAFAMFSDGQLHGGNWQTMPTLTDPWDPARPLWQEYPPYANPDSNKYPAPKPAYGGRKTNGVCVTDPITIIYNGPRKLIALTKTRVKDGNVNLVDITFTLIFNKAEKNLIILKDIKNLYDKPYLNIQFGNRGEWDFMPSSYVHFYTDEPVTCWDVNNNTDITPFDEGKDFFYKFMVANKYPKKWWPNVPVDQLPKSIGGVPFANLPESTTWFEGQTTCYDREYHTDKTIEEKNQLGTYAVAQVIDKGGKYVGAVAVWPHPEFWSVQNYYPNPYAGPTTIPLMLAPLSRMIDWHRWTVETDPNQGKPTHDIEDRENVWVKLDDMTEPQPEPSTPFIIYEHDFRLGVKEAYRIAAAYMLTDYHNADDADAKRPPNSETWSNGKNVIDREIQYQLNEIFNPWDINDAMHKNTKSWVEFFDSDIGGNPWDGKLYWQLQLPSEKETEVGDMTPCLPVYRGGEWDSYCPDSERVLVDTGSGYVLIYPRESIKYNDLDPKPNKHSKYYEINPFNGTIGFWKWDSTAGKYVHWFLPTGSIVKVLWSSEHSATTAETWDYYTLPEEESLNGENYIFPLHHDIVYPYCFDTEVFLIEQPPERIFDVPQTDGTPWYSWVTNTLTVYNVPKCKEVDVKYYTAELTWVEEKFHSSGSINSYQTFTLEYTAEYIEKVWIHSEKAITTGDYVCHENATLDTATLYLANPLPTGNWLFVNYTHGTVNYQDWFYGKVPTLGVESYAWDRNVFDLRHDPDIGSLHVYCTEIVEEVINASCYGNYPYGTWTTAGDVWHPNPDAYKTRPGGTKGPPEGVLCPVPDETSAYLPKYTPKVWFTYGLYAPGKPYQECEWINLTYELLRGNYIIQETPTCDQLVLDQPPQPYGMIDGVYLADAEVDLRLLYEPLELKIVYEVPSGRYEWATVGKTAASVDSLGTAMVTAAFKNKLIEIGLGGLDSQDTTSGPRIPWLIESTSPDALGRYHLYDDWCYSRTGDGMDTSWPISSSNIITVGGTGVNILGKYSNDWTQGVVVTTKPAYYPITCWNTTLRGIGGYLSGDVNARYGYAVISTYKDKNGTTVLFIHGWTGQDTYYACRWFDEHKYELQHINIGLTDLILRIDYKYSDGTLRCPPVVSIVEHLGTISEKPQHDC